MRAVFLCEEIMGVALKFSKKSSTMGSLLVSWEQTNSSSSPEKKKGLFTGHSRIIRTSFYLCLATIVFIGIVFCFVSGLDSSTAAVIHLNPAQSEPRTDTGQAALQGLGTIFRRGTRSMSELLVAHLSEDLSESELRVFLRTLHRSGISARADIVLLFDGDPRIHRLAYVVEEESQAFTRLLSESGCLNGSSPNSDSSCGSDGGLLLSNCSLSRLNLEAFARAEEEKRGRAEAALAKQRKLNNTTEEIVTEWRSSPGYNRILLGSVMGFDIAELDPLDTLGGFVDKPPIQLRRWLCYQMLLGMARQHHRYRQILITQARGVFIFNDTLLALSRRHKDGRGLVLVAEDRSWLEEAISDSRKNREILSDEEDEEEISESETRKPDTEVRKPGTKRKKRRRRSPGLIEEVYGRQVWGSIEREDKAGWTVVSSAVLAGGSRAVRTLADAVATEVARAAMMRHSRRAFADQAALNYVVRRNANILGRKVVERMLFVGGDAGVRVVTRDAGLPESTGRYDVIVIEGDSGDLRGQVTERIVKDLCSSPRERAVYNDCRES